MTIHFALTDDERSFLRHWSYESSCPFWGPASIWCKNHRISPAYGPYPLAELYWTQEIEAGREGWIFERPPIAFRVPWKDTDEFWLRSNAALAMIPRLQGDGWAAMIAFPWNVEGALPPEESNYLRAYYQEMVQSGSGHLIDLAHQHGVLSHHLTPFFVVLEDLERPPTAPVVYPWTDFPTRYEELTGRKYDYPEWALATR